MAREQQTELKRQLSSHLMEQIIGIRQRNRLVQENWLNNYRMWMNHNLERGFVSSDSSPRLYSIPSGRRAMERGVVRGVKLLTPNVKWFEMQPMNSVSAERADNVDKFMWYVLRKRIKSRSNISQLVRSMWLYGLCHMKTSVTVQNGQVWPSQRAVDPFAFYTFPETASTPDEAELIFEDFLFSYDKYASLAARGFMGLEPINRKSLTKPEWPYHLTERLAYRGITDTTQDINMSLDRVSAELERAGSSFVSLTELWLPKNDKLYQVYFAWNLEAGPSIVSFVQSEYDTPLYRSVVHRALPGELYTNSNADDINELNTMQNDDFNKFKEAVDRAAGYTVVNEQMLSRTDQLRIRPGALVKFSDDPRLVLLHVALPDTSATLLRAWQIEQGLINTIGGGGTIAEGQPGRNMPRSGGAVSSLISLSMADIQDISELIEQEVLTPALADIYKVSSQFIPEHQLMRIPGGEALYGGQKSSILRRMDIIGDYEFDWVGSLQFQDEQQNAQRMMIWLNLIPTLAPMLQQQGHMFNTVELVKLIWRYSLGQRGLSDIVVPIGQLSNGQPTAPQPLQQSNDGSVAPTQGGGVAGLNYRLPKPTAGFVKQ